MKFKVIFIFIAILLLFVLLKTNNNLPDDWKDKKLYDVSDGRDWIIIRNDNTFNLHVYIPNSEETFEWNGTIKDMELNTSKKLIYQGRNDYLATEIDPKIELLDISGKFLRINFKFFNTISGSYEIDGRNYTPINKNPF